MIFNIEFISNMNDSGSIFSLHEGNQGTKTRSYGIYHFKGRGSKNQSDFLLQFTSHYILQYLPFKMIFTYV